MTQYPIPNDALDDRLAVVGATGSGKSYMASGAVERVLARKGRAIVVDPLGVWFGLRLEPDGKTPSQFNVVIFGGPHGDLPINEHAGALIGETVAGMAESCIVDLSEIGTKNGERRFMLAFLTALYRKTGGDLVHLVIDEADMFAPQKLEDKEGEAAKLLGMMETIVRRGRIKGFIPWLITQRPAVLNKNVLSQADGVVAMKLTGEHDRKAIGGWIEGQSDLATSKAILASLPSKQKGEGVVWIPGRGILDHVQFPVKATFDSSRAPKRGEKKHATALKPIDLGSLKERLATVETEIKANDPKALKQEVLRLTKELSMNFVSAPAPDLAAIDHANKVGFAAGYNLGHAAGYDEAVMLAKQALTDIPKPAPRVPMTVPKLPKPNPAIVVGRKVEERGSAPTQAPLSAEMNSAAKKMLAVIDTNPPVRRSWQQVATLAGLRARGGHFNTGKKALTESGMIAESNGLVEIASPSASAASPSTDPSDVVKLWEGNLSGAAPKILRTLFEQGPATRESIAETLGMQPRGGHWNTAWKELRDNEIVQFNGPIAELTELFNSGT